MGTFGSIKTAVSDITGHKFDVATGSSEANERQTEKAINWAKNDLGLEKLDFLKTRAYINVTANTLVYDLASDFNTKDKFYICKTENIIGSVTTWTLDTSANKTGSVDAALDGEVGENSVIMIDGVDYVVQSVTGDGTTADSVELDYAAATGTIRFISDSSENTKNLVEMDEAEYLEKITGYPATSTKDCPEKYIISGTAISGTDISQTVYFGNPTPDSTYLVMYDYYASMPVMDTDTTEYIFSQVYRDDTPLIYGAVRYCYLNYWQEERFATFVSLYSQERAKVLNKLTRRIGGDFSG